MSNQDIQDAYDWLITWQMHSSAATLESCIHFYQSYLHKEDYVVYWRQQVAYYKARAQAAQSFKYCGANWKGSLYQDINSYFKLNS